MKAEKKQSIKNNFPIRIGFIEGLRGIAAFMVLLSHFVVAFFPAFYWGGGELCAHWQKI